MAEIKLPIKIDGFKCVEDMAQAVLNYTYKGKTLKEWVDSISEPHTNADRIRAMSVEEMAEWLGKVTAGGYGMCAPGHYDCTGKDSCAPCWLDWLKEEVSE